MKQITVIIFGLLIFSLACKKAKGPSLPPETQIGANTIGYKLNGEVYSTSGKLTNSLFMRNGVRFNGPNIEAVFFGKKNFRGLHLDIVTKVPVEIGVYTDIKFNYMSPVPNSNSKIKVTKYDGKVFSGTFQMDIPSDIGLLHITEGRFDISSE